MSISMPSPTRFGKSSVFYLRVRTPTDISAKLKGQIVSLPVGEGFKQVRYGPQVKVSLDTREPNEAKRRFIIAYDKLQSDWELVRKGPNGLTTKQALAIAGEVRAAFVAAFDSNPGSPDRWEAVLERNAHALKGGRRSDLLHPISPSPETLIAALDDIYGDIARAVLSAKGQVVTNEAFNIVLKFVGTGLSEAATVNLKKANYDYSDTGDTSKYPAWEAAKATRPATGQTFHEVIDAYLIKAVKMRDRGPPRENAVRKYKRHTKAFGAFRKSDILATATPLELSAWRDHELSLGTRSRRTIADMIGSVNAVAMWDAKMKPENAGATGIKSRLSGVERPQFRKKLTGERAYTLEEASAVLRAARDEITPPRRWLPWVSAYTGARVEELVSLKKSDIVERGGRWFIHISTDEGQTMKNEFASRFIPVHRCLVTEGFIEFATGIKADRLFMKSSARAVRTFIRKAVGITRPLPPNHGWRHLFEDLCRRDGVSDTARTYITGRSSGGSGDEYGRSEALWAGLAVELDKIKPIIPMQTAY